LHWNYFSLYSILRTRSVMPPHVLVQLIEQETEALADGARQQG